MKNTNKILSFILASAIMVSVFANLPLIKVSAASTKIKDSIVNNFDESGVTYTTNGTFDAKTKNNLYTSRTYNGNTIEYFSMYDTIIDKTTDADGNETWAARFGKAENTEGKSWPNILRLYDSNATDLGLYKPTANTEYTIRFNYKVAAEDVDEKNLMFKLVYENENSANNGFRYAAGNVVSSSVVYIRGTTSKWQTAEATFTTGATVNNLTLMMFSHNAAGQSWWNDETDVWVDNIEIIPARINPEPADFITKEEIYSENFSKYSVGAVPEGWVRDYAFKNLWAANKATAYTSEANVGVTENGTLKYTSATGGHIMTLPATGTDSYYLEVKYKFTNLNGAFGIVTEIDDNYASGTKSGDTTTILSVTPREIYVDSWYDVEEGGLTINTRKYYGNDYQGQDVSPVKYYAPSYFSGAKVATDTEYTLSCYHSGGVSYFYCNNKYVGKVEDYFDDVRTTVGLYNYGASVEITSVKINSIFHASNFEENIPSSSLIMYEDFSDIAVGTDVSDIEGWTQVKDGFTWNGGNGKATVKKFNGINTLAVQAKGGTAALVMPKPNVENYVVSVNVYLYNEDPNGAVGLLTNVPDQINDNYASHATQSVLYLSGNSLAGQIKLCNRTTKDNNVKNKVLSDYTDESLSGMHELELKAYVYDDTSYFFVNGAYIGATKHAYAEDATRLGFYQMFNTWDEVYVTSAKILSLSPINETSAVKVDSMAIRYATDENIANELSGGIKVNGKINTSDEFYLNNKDNAEYGLLLAEYDKLSGSKLTVEELSALNYSTKDDLTETENGLLYSVNLVNLSAEEMSKCYVARAYVKVDNENGESEYYYSDSVEFWPAVLADDVYENQNDAMKKIMDDFYSGTDVFKGSNKKQVKFSLFSDLHYKEGMYIASVSDLENILTRADENEVDFVIQAGDFSNDFKGSPELLNAYLQNPQNLSVYGVYGNHELESGNSMDFVTQKLTNKTDSVVWGTADGKIGDGSIGYYYFDDDESGLRFIFLDTNYSLNPATGKYEHNATGSYGAPAGNIGENSLGTEQLNWFKNLLLSSAKAGKSCVITSHTSFSEIWGSSPDAPAVLEIFDEANHIYPRTVLMAINGHHHTNQFAVKNNILFMDVNTVFNGYWQSAGTEHYTDETFKFTSYNEDGTAIETIDKNVSELTQAKNTYFFTDPLNAIVSISNSGEITVDGAKTTWFKNVVPDVSNPAKTPEIFSGTFNLGINKNFNLTLGNISILGDSYSAYSGYIPEGYPAWYNSDKDVKSVEQTWWKQLIDETDSNLLVNCSYSGSTICNTGYNGADATSTSFIARMKDYFSSDSVYNNADTIFLFGGTNDSWANSPIGELKYSGWTNEDLKSVLPAFCYMISYIKENNPNARIINVINYGLKSDIVSGMKTACEYYGIDCISLTQFSVSEGHPTVDGMTQIKNQIVDYLITKDSANSNTSDDFPLEKLGRKLVWNDEFAGTSLNEEQWTNARLMDNLVATYDNSEKNLRVENNNLHMQVNRLDDGSYTLSESVTTKNRMSFKYGYLEMRAKLPYRHAAWPSLWMLADRDYHDESIGWCAEIDILEVFSSASELSANLHKWGDGNSGHEDISNISSKKDRSYKFSNPDTLNDEYHIYGFAWDKDKMQFFVDGVLYYEILINENSPFVSETYNNTDGFHEPVYIILNNEIFTDKLDWYPENGCITDEDEMPIDYYVDYIRLYQDSEQESIYFK